MKSLLISNEKIVWKQQPYCWYSCLNLKFLRLLYRECITIAKIAAYHKQFPCVDDFDAVLAVFCSYCYDGNASEAVEMISVNEKDYLKCLLCVTVCIATTYQ